MAKILLVEDDNNLREIYEARLQAEGYEIVSAMDGEEALVVAKKEKPDLVISDVMMPRISGFEMLDILRNTDGLKDVRVIMLTALGQAEDKARADSLGADRYLVKSQVTLEDIVKAAQELIGGQAAPAAPASLSSTPPVPATPAPAPPAPAQEPTVAPVPVIAPPEPVPTPPVPAAEPTQPAVPSVPSVVTPPAPTPEPPAAPPEPAASAPDVPTTTSPSPVPVTEPPAPSSPMALPPAPSLQQSVTAPPAPAVEPASTPSAPASEPSAPEPTTVPPASSESSMAQSTSEEEATVKAQIEDFVKQNSQTAPSAPEAAPALAPTSPPIGNNMMADAIKDLVSDAQPQEKEKPAEEKIVEPPADATAVSMPTEVVTPNAPDTATTEPQASAKEDEQSSSDDDSSTVAHKKIIKPITDDSVAPQSDLSELLAKEGITNEEDETHPAPNANPPSQPQVPGGLPTTPHPPGHIISPNDQGGVDPSSISL